MQFNQIQRNLQISTDLEIISDSKRIMQISINLKMVKESNIRESQTHTASTTTTTPSHHLASPPQHHLITFTTTTTSTPAPLDHCRSKHHLITTRAGKSVISITTNNLVAKTPPKRARNTDPTLKQSYRQRHRLCNHHTILRQGVIKHPKT
jgi:hypothetical protein